MLSLHIQFPFVTFDQNGVCDVCHFAKHKRLSYNLSSNKALIPYDLLHFDIWGPISIQSSHGHKYFLTVVDDYRCFTWIILLKTKGEAREQVQNLIKMLEVNMKLKLKL